MEIAFPFFLFFAEPALSGNPFCFLCENFGMIEETRRSDVMTNRLPEAVGPYSAYRTAGDLLVTSGQLPLDPETNDLKGATASEQAAQCLENLKTILDLNKGSLDDVVKTTVYLNSMGDFAAVNETYAGYFKEPYPARTAFEVGKLPKDALVEIEAIAYLPASKE